MKLSSQALLLGGALTAGLLAAEFRRRPGVTVYALREENPLRLLLLSDFHATRYGEKQEEILSLIRKQSPDALLLTGDFFDGRRPAEPVWELLRGLLPLAPVFFVSGNHEENLPARRALFDRMRGMGVRILHAQTALLETRGRRITLSGVPDIRSLKEWSVHAYRSLFSPFTQLKKEDTNILLVHRPEFLPLYREYPFGLVLCGHAHGGQARIPFTGQGLIAPGQGFFPKWSGGRYDEDGITMIVSRGLSRFAHLPRLFNPPELVLILV